MFLKKSSGQTIRIGIQNRRRSQPHNVFSAIFLLGMLIKYDYLAILIFQIPSISLLTMKNILFLLLYLICIHPLTTFRKGRSALWILSLTFTIFFFLNIWYNRYFGNYLSMSDILMGRGIRPAKVLFFQLLSPWDLLFTIDCIVLPVIVHRLSTADHTDTALYTPAVIARKKQAAIFLLLFFLHMFGSNTYFDSKSPVELFRRSSPAFMNVYGIFPLYLFESALLFFPDHFPKLLLSEEPIPFTQNDLIKDDTVNRVKNIICIQMESIDNNLLGLSYNGREVTPFLNTLRQKSLYFENFYAQHVNGSFDAEYSFFTSLYPLNKHYGFKVNALESFNSLIGILNDRNYNTLAFHGNDKSFFYRDKAYDELGFNRFYSREDFDESAMLYSDAQSALGINDYDFFLQSAQLLKQEQTPFFAFLISVSSHTPFDFYPEEMTVPEFADIQNPLVKGYFNSAAFLDTSLKMFFSQLEEYGLLEDSLVIVYSDHDAGVEKIEYSSKSIFELKRPVKAPESIPLFLFHDTIEPGVSQKEGSHADLGPTVLDILGEVEKPPEFMGYSLIKPINMPVLFLHELPQLLHEGQLFVLTPTGDLEPTGYEIMTGERQMDIPYEDYLLMLDYLKDIVFQRRTENNM